MGAILVIAIIVWGVAKLSDYSALYEHNKWYKGYSEQFDINRREAAKKMAREHDYAIGAMGMVDSLRYSDGSCRYVPSKNGGDGNQRAEKGKYFSY